MHEWVKQDYCIGFVTTKGLIMDLDDVQLKKVVNIANKLMIQHKLEGYLVVESSPYHYHLVFNRYLPWHKIIQILFNQYICIRWAIWQARKGELTLRISRKNKENKPQIICQKGKTDKLIHDYQRMYDMFLEY